jgi:hypothetical protein
MTDTNRQVLDDFDVPDGYRVLSRAYKPVCIMGYAVTLKGAERLLYKFGLKNLAGPLDIEIMCACDDRSLSCLEINPALVGVYRSGGASGKVSDIDISSEPEAPSPLYAPMGVRSAKSMLRKTFDSSPEY